MKWPSIPAGPFHIDGCSSPALDVFATFRGTHRNSICATADKTVPTLQYWATTSEWSETRYDVIDALKDGLKSEGVALK